MTSTTVEPTPGKPSVLDTASGRILIAEPFLHVEPGRLYNPLTDRSLQPEDRHYDLLRSLVLGHEGAPERLPPETCSELLERGWLVEPAEELAQRYRLKYVSLEAHTVCNQACYFCPVSVAPRDAHFMSMELYETIARQLADHRETLEGVSMINYNEPTLDRRFVDQVALLRRYGLPSAVLTNGTGLTPNRVDSILGLGGVEFLSVNLSTLDRDRYRSDRQEDHLEIVLRNLDYMRDKPVAARMEIVVLGKGDEIHRQDFERVERRFTGSRFAVLHYEVMDRAGFLGVGLRPGKPVQDLCGCEQTGSRPLQWLHINPFGQCVLCCQDYNENYVVGDLTENTLEEVLEGPAMAMMRRWAYGLEQAPEDFICRNCVYALVRE